MENLFILYILFLPATIACLGYGYHVSIDGVSATNTFGGKLFHLMLRNELGLLLIGGSLVIGATACLTIVLWCLYLPLNALLGRFNNNIAE